MGRFKPEYWIEMNLNARARKSTGLVKIGLELGRVTTSEIPNLRNELWKVAAFESKLHCGIFSDYAVHRD